MKNVEATVSELSRTLASGALLSFRLALRSSLLRSPSCGPQTHPQLSFHPVRPFCVALDTMVMVSTLTAQCQVCFFRLGYI